MVQVNPSFYNNLPLNSPNPSSRAPEVSGPGENPEEPGDDPVWAWVGWTKDTADGIRDTWNDVSSWLKNRGLKFGNGGFTYHRGNLQVSWGNVIIQQPNVPGVGPGIPGGKGITVTFTF